MVSRIRYRPRSSQADLHAFEQRLKRCPGSWRLYQSPCDEDRIVRPRWIVPEYRWGDIPGFLNFFDCRAHRELIRLFIIAQPEQCWSFEDLLARFRQRLTPSILEDALRLLEIQELIRRRGTSGWQRGCYLQGICDLGPTFEWLLQMVLEREYSASCRRHVILGELADLGEIDVLALLADGRALLIESKSSSKGLTDRQLERFFTKAQGFPAGIALLLIDTDDPHQMQQRAGQLAQAIGRVFGNVSGVALRRSGGSSIVHLRENLFIADTGGGILTTFQAVLAP